MNYLLNIFVRRNFIILAFLAGFISCNQNPNSFTLKGSIKNMNGRNILFVRDYPDSVIVDTIKANKDGKFEFKGTTDTLMLGTLFFNEGSSFTQVFFDKGEKIKLNGDATFSDLIEISGNDIDEALSDFRQDNKEILQARAKLLQSFKKMPESSISRPPKPNPGLISKMSNFNYQLSSKAAEFIKKNPDKIASVVLIQDFFRDNDSVDQMDKKLQSLKEPASKSALAYQLRQYVTKIKASQVGANAPDFFLKDAKGVMTRYDQFRGKYFVLSFVSDDSPQERENKKELSEIYEKNKGKNVEILSVVVVEDDVQNNGSKSSTSSDLNVNWNTVNWKVITLKNGWSNKILSDYNVNDLPLVILIAPDGKIIVREESPAMVAAKLPVK